MILRLHCDTCEKYTSRFVKHKDDPNVAKIFNEQVDGIFVRHLDKKAIIADALASYYDAGSRAMDLDTEKAYVEFFSVFRSVINFATDILEDKKFCQEMGDDWTTAFSTATQYNYEAGKKIHAHYMKKLSIPRQLFNLILDKILKK